MIFNTVENLEYCREIVDSVFGLLLYSHFFPIIASIISLIIILLSTANGLLKKIFSAVVIFFLLWVVSNLSIWIFYDQNNIMMFAWSSIELFATTLFALLLYFIYVLINGTDVSNRVKIIWFILLSPLIIGSFTQYNLIGIDLSECVAIENKIFIYYASIAKIIFSSWLVIILTYFYYKNKEKRNKILLPGVGVFVFFISFLTMGYLASVTGDFKFEFYGLFGMVFFIFILTFAINRYRIINIKIITTELLVIAIILLISSQFLYLQNRSSFLLNGVTLIFVSVLGFSLIRSVRKEIETKELIQQNSKLIVEANQNQQSLIHFISHQIKGYMTKSRNIFDGMLTGDYGNITDDLKRIAQHGFDSDTQGVETVQAILKATDLKSGKILFNKSRINISKLVAEIAEKAKDSAIKKGLDFSFDIDPNLEAVIDVIQIGELLTNLISNAIIYTKKGEIKITLKEKDSSIRFSVIDTGFGLTNEDKENLFREGGKSKDALSVNVESTGYGLFISKKIAEEHNGKIGAHSEGRNKGSEFFVILPRIQ